ncbi:MAG: 4'-phosphopantetheinyl transferase superfamily protein, partial [Chloroflexota bacterium]|nr:4'-phosphopantetheinyl transferase superfamily protein [Chloroflexota bacterium]
MYIPEFDPDRSGIIAVGVDVIEIARIQRVLDAFGERFLHRIFTAKERDRYRNRVSELAARF